MAVIWALVFFAVLSVGITRVVASQAGLLQRVEGWVLGEAAMRSACGHARREIQNKKEPYWSQADLMRERAVEFGIARVRYHFVDQESRININAAPQDVLARLPGLGPDLATKILASPLRPFPVTEALLWVEDLDEKAFAACRDHITVHSNTRVNINTASPVVLQALGLEAVLATAIDTARRGPDGDPGTDDDGIFEDTGSIETVLAPVLRMTQAQKERLDSLFNAGMLGVSSENFTLKAVVDVLGKRVMDYDIVLSAYKVMRWQEY